MEIDKLKIRLGIDDNDNSKDDILDMVLEDAEAEILDYCKRSILLPKMESLKRNLAITYYNRQGSEGESSRSEGGVSVSYSNEIPESIKSRLNSFRRLKAVSIANENKK